MDEEDGMIYPLLRGEVDGRHMLAGADIIIGRATTSADQFCIYGCDLFMTEEYLKDFGICL